MMKKEIRKSIAYAQAKLSEKLRSITVNKPVVVFESDDWGAMRISNLDAVKFLERRGFRTHRSVYMKDCLETKSDLNNLFSVLRSNVSLNGALPQFTANVITSNPDFDKIRETEYSGYHAKSLLQHDRKEELGIIQTYQLGETDGVFVPEFHGKEHVNRRLWLKDLQEGKSETHMTFDLELCGLPLKVSHCKTSYYTHIYEREIDSSGDIREGITQFVEIFNRLPRSTVAPNVTWGQTEEEAWHASGIKSIQSGYVQNELVKGSIRFSPKFSGQVNELGQIYTVRNVTFEPCRSRDKDYWKRSFEQLETAVEGGRPAIVSTHRVNFVGGISTENAQHGLDQLSELLRAINLKYPDVLYLSTWQLLDMILTTNHHGKAI